jgi:HSP20 family protein
MILTKYNPIGEFRDFSNRFSSLVDEFDNKELQMGGFSPISNIREDELAYYADVDLPGVKKEDINVEVKNGVITISGERKHKKEIKKDDYYRLETSFGKFERSFILPKSVDSDNITAANKNGVLEVVIPKLKNETNKAKKIEVK